MLIKLIKTANFNALTDGCGLATGLIIEKPLPLVLVDGDLADGNGNDAFLPTAGEVMPGRTFVLH